MAQPQYMSPAIGPARSYPSLALRAAAALRSSPPRLDQRSMRRRASWAIAAALLVLAAAVRFWGICWGAPERIDLHPDEMQHVMSHALAISLADPDPHFLNYPSLLIYLIAIANGALTRLGVVTEPWQVLPGRALDRRELWSGDRPRCVLARPGARRLAARGRARRAVGRDSCRCTSGKATSRSPTW